MLLYAVTDRAIGFSGRPLKEVVQETLWTAALPSVQLREKALDRRVRFLTEAHGTAGPLPRNTTSPLLSMTTWKLLVRQMGADGVHVGQSDMEAEMVREKIGPDKILGVSAQTVEQAMLRQQKQGADYLGVGAVFHTGSKDDADDVFLRDFEAPFARRFPSPWWPSAALPRENVKELAGSGICGVAVISAIYAADHIEKAARDLKEATREMLCQ